MPLLMASLLALSLLAAGCDTGGGSGGGGSQSGNADLAGITLGSGTLSPAFNAETTAYTVSVENDVTSVSLSAEAVDDGDRRGWNGKDLNRHLNTGGQYAQGNDSRQVSFPVRQGHY